MSSNLPGAVQFSPGLELSERFYLDAVRPILDKCFPGLIYSAALIGYGSDVIGFDDLQSTDHMWGPRLYLFLQEEQLQTAGEALLACLRERLPHSFQGYSTHFVSLGEPGIFVPGQPGSEPLHPLIWVESLPGYVRGYLGFDIAEEPAWADWLTFSEHKLLSLVSGKVFHDGLNMLEPLRRRLAWYPHDVWLYLLAAGWQKIGQEEPFVGRAGQAGDDLGSRLVAARLVRAVMHLAFLMERRYAPYSKWFGTAFARLECAPRLAPHLTAALEAADWREREMHLGRAYELTASLHNQLGITAPVNTRLSAFHNRPFQVIHGDEIAGVIMKSITGSQARALPGLPGLIGSVNQWVESTDVVSETDLRARLLRIYETGEE